jgi:hypothetical protein
MIRRLLTTLLPIIALGACGMPEDGEWPVDEQGQTVQAIESTVGFAVSPGGAAADIPQADETSGLVATNGANLPVLLLSTGGSSDPGGAVSSTQDPIPAKNRRDGFDSRSRAK